MVFFPTESDNDSRSPFPDERKTALTKNVALTAFVVSPRQGIEQGSARALGYSISIRKLDASSLDLLAPESFF